MFLSPISSIHRFAFGAIASALLLTTAAMATAGAQAPVSRFAAPTPRIIEHVDEDRLSTLSGNTRPEARSQYDRGAVSPDMRMDKMTLVLRRGPEQQAAFDAFLASQYDQKSPNFHKWLTPDEVGANFGLAQADIDAVTSWLQNHGFSVDEVAKSRLFITFSGTAGQVQSAFHTEIHHLDVKGVPHVANMRDPQIPSALTPVVVGVQALHNFFPKPLHRLGSQAQRDPTTGAWKRISSPATASGAKAELGKSGVKPQFGINLGSGNGYEEDVTPYDFATIYNVLPLWTGSGALDGTGQSIAIVATSNINPTDITNFRKAFGLPAGKSIIVKEANGDPGDCPSASSSCINDLYENTLDVEWSGAMAHNAQIILVVANGGTGVDYTSDPVFIDMKYIVDNNTAPIVNVSYGECELGLGTAANTAVSQMWSQASAQGQSVFVASGDEGSASCDAGGDANGTPYAAQLGLSVSGLASTPYNTAVGGTDFNWVFGSTAPAPYWSTTNNPTTLANAVSYIPEVPWNGTCTNPLVLPTVQYYAQQLGVSGVTDAETACSFIYEYDEILIGDGGPDLSFLIDTVGGSGGVSSCTVNSTTSTSTSLDPTSCSGGYAKPSWQSGVTGIPNDGKRDIPDLSFFASSGFLSSAYLVCVSYTGATCTYSSTDEPISQEVGGTSVASPITAGIMALINQAAKSNQGLMNPELYKLAKTETFSSCLSENVTPTTTCIFNDVDTGTIAMPCDPTVSPNCTDEDQNDPVAVLSGWAATTGFDLATGLGSANVANLVHAYVADVTPAPGISLNPNTLTFPSTTVLTAATNQTITVSNSGTANLTFTSVALSGSGASSFNIVSNTCTGTIAASATCKVTIGFTPASAATLTASVVFSDNVTGSPQSVSLSGVGVAVVSAAPAVSLNPTSLTFASTEVGSTATAQTVTLTNTGNAPLIVTQLAISSSDSGKPFAETDNCVGTIAAGASCTITVTFTPDVIGSSITGTLSIADNAAGSPQTVSLTGTATTSGTFALTATNVTANMGSSGTSTVTVTPSGGYMGTVTLTCSVAAVSGGTDAPTCTPGAAIAVTSASAATGTITLSTTAAAALKRVQKASNMMLGAGGTALACLMLFGIPARKRNWQSMLGVLVLFAGLGALAGCGGGGGGNKDPGTTAGTYTVTVTGTDNNSTVKTTTFTLTVN